jgi:hypothetical protein
MTASGRGCSLLEFLLRELNTSSFIVNWQLKVFISKFQRGREENDKVDCTSALVVRH